MSTKIYNGYRLTAGTDPFTFIHTSRPALDHARDQADSHDLADRATRHLDNHLTRTGNTTLKHSALQQALHDIDEQNGTARPGTRDDDPNSLELSFGRDPDTGRTGVLLFTHSTHLRDAFDQLPEVEPYKYWNNTDQPADLTDHQWAKRREFWDRLLPGAGTPAESMLTWTLRGPYHPGTMSLLLDRSPLILDALPTLDDRVQRVVVGQAAQQVLTNSGVTGQAAVGLYTDTIYLLHDHPDLATDLAAAARDALIPDLSFTELLAEPNMLDTPDQDSARARVQVEAAKLAEVITQRLSNGGSD